MGRPFTDMFALGRLVMVGPGVELGGVLQPHLPRVVGQQPGYLQYNFCFGSVSGFNFVIVLFIQFKSMLADFYAPYSNPDLFVEAQIMIFRKCQNGLATSRGTFLRLGLYTFIASVASSWISFSFIPTCERLVGIFKSTAS